MRTRSKRARSPDAETSPGRAVKRLSVATEDTFFPGHNAPKSHNSRSKNSSRHPSEDWVQQTGGLSIDSPVYPPYNGLESQNKPTGVNGMGVLVDEDMNMESDESPVPTPALSPALTSSHDASTSGTSTSFQGSTRPQDTPMSASLAQQYHLLPSAFNNVIQVNSVTSALPLHMTGPAINVLPPTPGCSSVAALPDTEQQTQPSTRESSPTPMVISAAPSIYLVPPNTIHVNDINSIQTKRQKFSIGPRADCEKCRLGIKGHWAHLD